MASQRAKGAVPINRSRGRCALARLASYLRVSVGVVALLANSAAWAQQLPTGGSVAAGTATIAQPNSSTLNINQSSNQAVINWNTFSVGRSGTVNFNQPSSSSATLNRVTGSTPSWIAGTINAPGTVLLVNPNGIAITKSGVINTGSFAASTLDISNADFMAGKYKFTGNGGSAAVRNSGRINVSDGGFAALLGGQVANDGVISARLGKVGLGAGELITLDLAGDGFLSVAVPSSQMGKLVDASGALVSNRGKIRADGGSVFLTAATASTILRDAVNVPGSIRANTVGTHNGRIVIGGGDGGRVTVTGKLAANGTSKRNAGKIEVAGANVALNGKVSASGKNGGNITVASSGDLAVSGTVAAKGSDGQGGRIDLTGANIKVIGALIDASGTTGGGLVRIGGTFQGGHGDPSDPLYQSFIGRFGALPAIASAQTVTIDAGTTIDVSAKATGDAGTAVVWSDQVTSFTGTIIGNGGSAGGNGGFAEVSGKALLDFDGTVNLLAANGSAGTLLLDPFNVTISTSTSNNITGSAAGGTTTYTSGSAATSVVRVSTLQTALATTNVVVNTGGSSSQLGNITIANAIMWTSANTLTLNAAAGGSISVNTNATVNAVNGALVLNSGTSIAIGATINVASLTLNATTNVTQAANITATNLRLLGTGASYTLTRAGNSVGTLAANTGSVNLVSSGNLTIGTVGGTAGITASGAVTIGTAGSLTINNNITETGGAAVKLTVDTGGTGTGTITFGNGLAFSSAGTIKLYANGYSGTTPSMSGGGTLTAYTTIYTLAGLQNINNNLGGNFALMNNIDASGLTASGGFMPIGSMANPFSGSFDGQNNVISGIFINRATTDYVGLFGVVTGSVANVGLSGGSITGQSFVGSVAGLNSGSISNVYSSTSVGGATNVGGLVGGMSAGSVFQSYATGNVTASGDKVGGLVGSISGGSIAQTYSSGVVSGVGTNVGGFAGLNNGTVSASYWDATLNPALAGIGGGTTTGATGLTSAQFANTSSFVGWTFGTTAGGAGWVIVDADSTLNNAGGAAGATRPFLLSEASTNGVIGNAHQMQLIALNLAGSYKLGNDINMSETAGGASSVWFGAGFVPLGNAVLSGITPPDQSTIAFSSWHAFTGTFDGQNHTISNLTINRPSSDFVGLFGYISQATVKNVALSSGSVTGRDYTGGLIGEADWNDATGTGTAQSTLNTVSSGVNVTGRDYVGGLLGYMRNSQIDNGPVGLVSSASGNVSGRNYVGGLLGFMQGDGFSFLGNVSATGNVNGNLYVGGLIGYSFTGGYFTDPGFAIYATGNVTGVDAVGGLVGWNNASNFNGATMYATGAVSGTSRVGGFAGFDDYDTLVANSFATGSVTGVTDVGGLVGNHYEFATIDQSFATGVVKGVTNVGGLVGYSIGAVGSTTGGTYATGAVYGTTNVGGLVGNNATFTDPVASQTIKGSITNSFAIGYVNGTTNVGGLVGNNMADTDAVGNNTPATITKSFFNTETAGTSIAVGAVNGTGATATGATTSTLQSMPITGAGSYGWTASVWGIVAGSSLPYLKWLYPTAPQVVSGTAYSDRGTTPLAGTAAGLLVSGLSGTAAIAAASAGGSTGANGYFYFLTPNGTFFPTAKQVLVYTAGANGGATFNETTSTAAVATAVTGLNIYGTYLKEQATSTSTLLSTVNADRALAVNGNAAAVARLNTLANLEVDATAATFAIDQTISTGTLLLSGTGTWTQSAAITANTLMLLGTGATHTLTNAGNAITNLGTVTLGAGSLNLVDTGGLTVTGVVGATGGITLNTSGTLAINAALNAGLGNVSLNTTAGGAITQSATGVITGNTLLLSTDGGSTSLNAATNVVTNLGTTTLGAGTLNLLDAGGLTVTGAVGATGGITLNTSGALAINNTVNAGAGNVSLTTTGAGNGITQSAGGAITANTLALSTADGNATLDTATNAVSALGNVSIGNGALALKTATAGGLAVPGASITANGGIAVTNTTGGISTTGVVQAGNGAVALTATAGNIVTGGSVIASGGSITLTSTNGSITLGGSLTGTGVSLTSAASLTLNQNIFANSGNVLLNATGANSNITQTAGRIQGAGLLATALNGSVNLTAGAANNSVATIAGRSNGNFAYTAAQSTALSIGTVSGTSGIVSSNGNVAVTLTNSATPITVGQAVTASNGNVTLSSGGNLTINAAVTANTGTGVITLTSTTGAITEFTGGSLTGAQVAASAGTNVDLRISNTIGTFAANAGSGYVVLFNNGSIALDLVGAVSGVTAFGDVVLETVTDGNIAQTANGKIITGGGLVLQALNGSITLDQANSVSGNFAVAGTSSTDVTLRNTGNLNIGTVAPAFGGSYGGVNISGTLSLNSTSGSITQSAGIIAGTIQGSTGGGNMTLLNSGNNFGSVGPISLGAGFLALADWAGDLTVTGAVAANGMVLQTPGALTINAALNAGTTGNVQLSATGAGGAISQSSSGVITANALSASATTVSLTAASNLVSAIGGVSTGGFSVFSNKAAITVNNVSATGGQIAIFGNNTANMTVAGTVNSSGGNILLAAGGILTINGAVTAGTGSVVLEGDTGITQGGGGGITAANLAGLSAAGDIALTANNAVGGNVGFNATSGSVSFTSTSGFFVGGISTVNFGTFGNYGVNPGIRTAAAGSTTLTAGGDITQTLGATNIISTGTLNLTTAGNASVALNFAVNTITNLGTVSLGTGSLTLLDAGGLTVTGVVNAGSVLVTSSGTIVIDNTITAAGVAAPVIMLTANGAGSNITQTVNGGLVTPRLALFATQGLVNVTAGAANNNVANIGGQSGGNFAYADSNSTGLLITTIFGGTPGIISSGDITVSVTKSGATLGVAQLVNAPTGTVTLQSDGNLTVGNTVIGANGVTLNTNSFLSIEAPVSAGTNTVSLTAANGISQTSTGVITGDTLTLSTNGGDATLNAATNAVANLGTVTLGSGVLNLLDAGGLTVTGAVGATGGITLNTSGALTLNGNLNAGTGDVSLTTTGAGNAVNQTGGGITAGTLTLVTNNASVTLNSATNVITNLGVASLGNGELRLADMGGLTVTGAVSAAVIALGAQSFLHIEAALNAGSTGIVALTGMQGISQTSAGIITANNLTLLTTVNGADLSATNQVTKLGFAQLGGGSGPLILVNVGGLTIAGQVLASSVTIRTTGGDLTIATGGTVRAGAGGAVLSTDANFINSRGADAVFASGGGRWLVYSAAPAGNTFGGLDSGNAAVWNATYATLPPGSVAQPGNRYIFAAQPTLTITSTGTVTKTYGDDATAPVAGSSFTVSGLQGVANAFTDTASDVYSGAPAFTSAGSAATADVTGSPYSINGAAGSLAALNGYAIAFVNNGTLTINKATLTATANTASRDYGDANPTLSGSITGFKNGQTVATFGGDVWSTLAGLAANVGSYGITGGLTNASPNYTITQVAANSTALTINKATLTFTANAASRNAGDANPALSGSIAGFKNGQTATTLGGDIWSTLADQASPAGSYAVAGNLTNAAPNYRFVQVAANLTALTVNAVPPAGTSGGTNGTPTGTPNNPSHFNTRPDPSDPPKDVNISFQPQGTGPVSVSFTPPPAPPVVRVSTAPASSNIEPAALPPSQNLSSNNGLTYPPISQFDPNQYSQFKTADWAAQAGEAAIFVMIARGADQSHAADALIDGFWNGTSAGWTPPQSFAGKVTFSDGAGNSVTPTGNAGFPVVAGTTDFGQLLKNGPVMISDGATPAHWLLATQLTADGKGIVANDPASGKQVVLNYDAATKTVGGVTSVFDANSNKFVPFAEASAGTPALAGLQSFAPANFLAVTPTK